MSTKWTNRAEKAYKVHSQPSNSTLYRVTHLELWLSLGQSGPDSFLSCFLNRLSRLVWPSDHVTWEDKIRWGKRSMLWSNKRSVDIWDLEERRTHEKHDNKVKSCTQQQWMSADAFRLWVLPYRPEKMAWSQKMSFDCYKTASGGPPEIEFRQSRVAVANKT